jgi:hypothetical protein
MLVSQRVERTSVALLCAGVVTALAGSCSNSKGNASGDCPAGAEMCPCYPNSTCDIGLSCLSAICVNTSGAGGQSSGTGGDVAIGGSDPGSGGSSGAAGATTGNGSAPRILTLNANTTTVTEKDQLVISLVATDPDGIEDVIGGVVKDPGTGGSYGALQSAAMEGSYSITLSWAQINTVSYLDAPAAGAPRTFRVQIFDMAGNVAEGDVTVTFKCSGDSGLTGRPEACGGICTGLDFDFENCGTCRHACHDVRDCRGGRCFSDTQATGALSCNEVCAMYGNTCLAGNGAVGDTFACSGGDVILATCDQKAPASNCQVRCACAY